MKKNASLFVIRLYLIPFVLFAFVACERTPNSDAKAQKDQERLLRESNSQVGMPAIKNFREKKILKDILELRDQANLITYTYVENLSPQIVHGHTVLGGKLTFVGETVGYPIPYSTQFTNPMKIEDYLSQGGYAILPQADPNALFSPASAEGTWILMKDPNGEKTTPVYMEPRIVTSQFKFPLD